jgi:hypothetical protein
MTATVMGGWGLLRLRLERWLAMTRLRMDSRRAMTGLILVVLIFSGCSCQETGLSGSADSGEEEETVCPDSDGDGFLDAACGGDDCDDSRIDIFPGADEVCGDNLDNDCDGLVDEPYFMLDNVLLNDETFSHWMDAGMDCDVSLLWTGSEFAAAWVFDEGPTCPGSRPVYFTRLDEHGLELGPDSRLVHDPSLSCYNATRFCLAWTGSEFGLAWNWENVESDGISRGLSFARLDSSGELLGYGLTVMYPDPPSLCERLLWTGSGFAMVWWESLESITHVTFLDAALSEVQSDVVAGSGPYQPSMVWTGSELGVFWVEIIEPDTEHEARMTRLDASGNVISRDLVLFEVTPGSSTKAVWTGSEFLLVWNEDLEAHFGRVSPEGASVGEDRVIYENADVQSLGWNGSVLGLIMKDGDRAFFGRTDETGLGVMARAELMSRSVPEIINLWSDLVWTGSEFGVAWTMFGRDSKWDIYFNRIDLCD